MSSSCENSMRWCDHQDRNCVNNKKTRFHVVAGESFRSHLRVPQEFGSHLREIMSDTIKLNSSNGCIHDIQISRELGEIVLRSGWDVFASAHNLEYNDYLVFKFCGKSSFKVEIYNSCDGSQKITSCVNPHLEILEAVPNRGEMSYAEHVQTLSGSDYFTSVGTCLTKAQDKKVLEIAQTIKSEMPLYAAVMNKSNVDLNCCFIRIPSILMKDIRENVLKPTVKLEAADANVYIVSATQQGNDEVVLQSGWDTFVVAHHVQERDLIIFIHKGNSRLEVFVLDRSGHQKTSLGFGMVDVSNTQEMLDDSVAVDMIDLSNSSGDEKNVAGYSAKSTRCQKSNFAKTRTMASTSCPSTKPGHLPITEGSSQPPYIISRKVSLSRVQKKMVLGKVQAIRSEFPLHVSVINKTNIGGKGTKMCFAMDYARRYLPSTTQGLILKLEGCQSKQWHTVLYVAGGHTGARDMRTIAGGWAKFVSDNCLRLGDICLFELVETKRRLRMNVHLLRKL